MTYYYETHISSRPRRIEAENDEKALNVVKEREGGMERILVVYTEEKKNEMRTVWEAS